MYLCLSRTATLTLTAFEVSGETCLCTYIVPPTDNPESVCRVLTTSLSGSKSPDKGSAIVRTAVDETSHRGALTDNLCVVH